MKTLILIDGSGLIYRGFYGIPPFFRSPSGVLTNAVFGFTSILLSLLKTRQPDYMAVAFDKKGPTFRHKEFKEYKATRVKAPQELYDQIPLVKKIVESLAIPQFEEAGFEADDIIATITENIAPNVHIHIATGDFDMFQLASPTVSILYPTKGFKDSDIFTPKDIEEKYELSPAQIPDYKGLAGDHSDNIPGVHGIGEKGAKNLLKQYGNLEEIYSHLDEIKGAMREKLERDKDQAFMSRQLATLVRTVPMQFKLEDCHVEKFNAALARNAFEEMGFKSLIKRLDEMYEPATNQESLF